MLFTLIFAVGPHLVTLCTYHINFETFIPKMLL